MQKLLVLAAVAFATSYAFDPECMAEFGNQKECFFGVVKGAFGANDDMEMMQMKTVTKECFEAQGCRAPPSLTRDGLTAGMTDEEEEPSRHKRHDHKNQKGGKWKDFKAMKDCVEEKKGEDPFKLVKDCVMEETGVPLPKFMMRPPKNDAAVFNSKKCPYFRMLKFIAMSGKMDEFVKKACGGDETKAEAVIGCVQEGTGVDMDNLDRDAIKSSMCENKDTCYTEKLTECKGSIRDMIKAACTCKATNLNEAINECATELSIELPPELTMECDALFELKKKTYDMCHAEFAWPADEVYMKKGHKAPAKRHRRHQTNQEMFNFVNDDHPILYFI